MSFKWSLRSLKEMAEIHPDLRSVCDKALELASHQNYDFIVIDGKRSREEQIKHYKAGASKILKSRHIHGFAIDFVPLVSGKIRWEPAHFKPLGKFFKQAAIQLRTPIVWGGDWKWKDWGHIELDKRMYPDPLKSQK